MCAKSSTEHRQLHIRNILSITFITCNAHQLIVCSPDREETVKTKTQALLLGNIRPDVRAGADDRVWSTLLDGAHLDGVTW